MSATLARAVAVDFSAGIFRGIRPERAPEGTLYDAVNSLVSDDGAAYRRGGSTYRSAAHGSELTFVWDGLLAAGQRTIIGNPAGLAVANSDGTITAVGGSGGIAAPRRAVVLDGVMYLPGGETYDGTTVGTAAKTTDFYAAVANRLFAGEGSRIDFSGIGAPGTFDPTDFHELPAGVQIVGMEPLRDSLAVFTTGGVWVISNVAFNLTDAEGNVQHRVDQYSRELMLWGDTGIAGWEGTLVVPGVDGVWLMARGVASEAAQPFQRISDPIAGLYKDYVRRGYKPGQAAVYRGHYVLPVLKANNDVADVLVCRLDGEKRPWSRLGGFGAKVRALSVRSTPDAIRQPELLGGHADGRLLTLEYFNPTGATSTDADGSPPRWEITTRESVTGRLVPNTIIKLRMGYELADAPAADPTISAQVLGGRALPGGSEWGDFEWGEDDWGSADSAVGLVGEAPIDTYGDLPFSWPVGLKDRFVRFRLACDEPSSRLVIRYLETFVRMSGRD